MPTTAINFTKTALQGICPPDGGRTYYKDSKERGLRLYITHTGTITFFIRKRVKGRDERIILGHFPQMTVENARAQALQVRAVVASGQDPVAEKRRLKVEITFGDMFERFMERYSKLFKRSWKHDQREVHKFLSNWFGRKASQINKVEIQHLHERISNENGLYQANRLLERISAIYNKAMEWGWEGTNPAAGIKKFPEHSRDRFIQPNEMPRFFASVAAEQNNTIRDYIYLLILTGARKSNLLTMRWDQICFVRNEWRIPETKNGEPLNVPLLAEAVSILHQRPRIGDYVFPGAGRSGHLQDPKKGWKRILKRAEISNLRIHDIRRTMGSYQAMTGASLPIIGRSLGHKSQQATQVYSRLNNDPVRASMEKAIHAMRELASGAADL